jgi:hypothetical protein
MASRRRRRSPLPLIAAALALIAIVVVVIVVLSSGSGGGSPQRQFESIVQDDQYLLYSPPAVVTRTLDTLQSLGANRLRVQVLWAAIAPNPLSTVRPRGFDATNPADYPAALWTSYDRLVRLAAARRIGVDFDVTAPGPLWAMARGAPRAKLANHYRPSPREFQQFVAAVGRRYGGSYTTAGQAEALPRVSYWSVWNEPNQPGWLAPQWRTAAGSQTMDSPRLYREYVDAAFTALRDTGHGTDTFLIGELAPEGTEGSRAEDPMPPMPFLRALYCVDSSYRPLRGEMAALLHCPDGGGSSSFVSAHPGLFAATGFAHHPYSFFLAPAAQMSDANFVPLSNLSRLETGLDQAFAAYNVHRQLPLYLTEYGYETNPPNPYRGVSLRTQSQYLNQAQYLAWQDPRVRALAQFLLYDAGPDTSFPPGSVGYWSTFQTGLLFANGIHKPSYNAYRLPIFIPDPVSRSGAAVLIWGMLRSAPTGSSQTARIEWRPVRGSYRTLTTVSTSEESGVLTARVQVPGSGVVRIAWTSPNGELLHSRSIGVQKQ